MQEPTESWSTCMAGSHDDLCAHIMVSEQQSPIESGTTPSVTKYTTTVQAVSGPWWVQTWWEGDAWNDNVKHNR